MLGCVRLSDNLRGILGKWGRGKYKKRRPTFDRYPIVVYHHSKISQLYQGMKKRKQKATDTHTDRRTESKTENNRSPNSAVETTFKDI